MMMAQRIKSLQTLHLPKPRRSKPKRPRLKVKTPSFGAKTHHASTQTQIIDQGKELARQVVSHRSTLANLLKSKKVMEASHWERKVLDQ